jgi:hypothetical protein
MEPLKFRNLTRAGLGQPRKNLRLIKVALSPDLINRLALASNSANRPRNYIIEQICRAFFDLPIDQKAKKLLDKNNLSLQEKTASPLDNSSNVGYYRGNSSRDSPKTGHNKNDRQTNQPTNNQPIKMIGLNFFDNLEYGYEYSSALRDLLGDPATHGVKSIEIDHRKEPVSANAEELFLIEIVCHDGSARLGRYHGSAYDVIDRLNETDTLQSWCRDWVANAGIEDSPAFVAAIASSGD